MGIIFGDISSVPSLNADSEDLADLEAFNDSIGPVGQAAVFMVNIRKNVGSKASKEITNFSRKRVKKLIKKLSDNSQQNKGLSQKKTDQLKRIVEKAGGKLRNDGTSGVKGSSAGRPHVQTEGLGKSIDSRHIWTQEGVK